MARKFNESSFGTPSQALLDVTNRVANRSASSNAVNQKQNQGGLEGILGNIKNWLTDTAGAVGNTLKDTYTAVAGGLMQPGQNLFREYLTGKEKELKDNVAKKYGFNSFNDISDEGFQNQDLVKELNAVSNTVKKARTQSSDIFNNNAITKNMMNTKQGEYGSNAIKTWNLGADVLTAPFQGPGQVALNAGQGYLSAIGDELKGKDVVADPLGALQGNSSVNSSFDWEKVGKEGTAQAAGNVVGGLAGMGIGDLGGKLLGKSGKISNIAGKALNSGLARGGAGGGAAGATTAGVETALNGGTLQDVLANAAAGGAQGAQMGGAMGLGMGIANRGIQMAKNKLNGGTTGTVEPIETTKNTTPEEEVNLMYGESELANGTNTKTSLGKKIAKTLEGSQANLTRKEARDIGIESAGDVVDKTYKRTGITDLQKQAVLANELTGAQDSLLDSVQRVALGATDDGRPRYVDITKVAENVDSVLDKNIPQTALSGKAREQLSKNIKADLYNNDIDTITKANNIRSTAMEYVRKSKTTPDIADINTAKALFQIADDIDDLSYSAVPKGNIDAMYETAISELKGRAKIAENNGIKDAAKAYNKLADELSNTDRTIENYRSFKKDFVNSSKVYQKTAAGNTAWNYNAGTIGTAALASAMSGNPLIGVPVAIASKALAIPAGEVATQALAKIGGKIGDFSDSISSKVSTPKVSYDAINPDVLNGVLRATNRDITNDVVNNNTLEGQLAASTTPTASQATTSALDGNYYAGLPTTTGTLGTGTLGATTTTGTGNTMQSTGNNFLDRLSVAMELAMEAGDLKAVTQMMDIYSQASKLFGDQSGTSKTSDLNATQQQNLVKLKTAGSALDQLEELFDKAGGGQGPLVGNISNFFGSIGMNSDNSTYNQLAEGLINQIAAAVGKTDSLNTEGEVERAMSLIPKITDDAATAKNKLAQLRAMLQTTTDNYNQVLGLTQ